MSLGPGCTPIAPGDMMRLVEQQLSKSGNPSDPNLKGAGLGTDAFLSNWPDELHMKNPRSKRFVAIRPSRLPVWQSIVQGSGTTWAGYQGVNTTFGFNMVFTCVLFNQINSDPEMRSPALLTQAVLGDMSFAMRVLSALQLWMPQDSGGNLLLREPGRMLDGGFQIQPVRSGTEWWSKVSADFEVKFTALMPDPTGGS